MHVEVSGSQVGPNMYLAQSLLLFIRDEALLLILP